MSPTDILLLVILGLCIMGSGFFSGSETAIVALPRERMSQVAQQGRRGKHLADLVNNLESTFGTLLVANNFVNILGASVATILAIDAISAISNRQLAETWGPWVSTLVITAVVLIVGEITPKTLASRRPEQFAMFVAPTIWWLGKIIAPVSRVFIAISGWILKLLRVGADSGAPATEQDIMALAVLSEAAGEIDATEREILESLFALADKPIRDVMTPRIGVVALEMGATADDARQAVADYGHSRFPVVAPGGTLDDVVGILYAKDLLRKHFESIDTFAREPVYIPESTSILSALQRMRRQKVSFVLVVDEHGGVDGVITVKDLISELVGDIQDEFDPQEPSIHQLGDRTWIVEGRVPPEDVSEHVGVELPDGPYSSIGGLYLSFAGKIPQPGEHLTIEGVTLTVVKMDKRRIDRLRVERTAGI